MKKTVTINISGRVFYIDDDAYTQLQVYLDGISSAFKMQDGGDEIIADIESRVAELFEDKIDRATGVVSASMVSEVIGIMGKPEDFTNAHEAKQVPTLTALVKPSKRLYRDVDNRIFGGVCAGIAAYFNIDITLVRVVTAVLAVLTSGTVILVYLILWIALPAAITTAQKLEMRGEQVTISNIEKTIKEEYEEMKKNFNKLKESPTYKKGKNWFTNMSGRDRTLLIIVGVIIGLALFSHMPFHPFSIIHAPLNVFTSVTHSITPVFNQLFFPGVLPFILILLVVGLVFKTVLKIILYLIAFVLIIALTLKVLFWLFGGLIIFA